MKRFGTALAALCLCVATATALELRPFRASYSIRAHGLSGRGELHLQQHANDRWSYDMHLQGRGLARLVPGANQRSRSEFHIVDGRVVPDSFTSTDNDQKYTFDWNAGRVNGTAARKPVDLAAQPSLLDTLSVQAALMQELLSGREPSRFVLVDDGRIKDYLYTLERNETLESIAGTHRTVIFSSRRPGSKKATYFWCAPDLGYLPLKVERRNGPDLEFTMTLAELER
jgi:hypothetical protein